MHGLDSRWTLTCYDSGSRFITRAKERAEQAGAPIYDKYCVRMQSSLLRAVHYVQDMTGRRKR